jgi:hypothetical protein
MVMQEGNKLRNTIDRNWKRRYYEVKDGSWVFDSET